MIIRWIDDAAEIRRYRAPCSEGFIGRPLRGYVSPSELNYLHIICPDGYHYNMRVFDRHVSRLHIRFRVEPRRVCIAEWGGSFRKCRGVTNGTLLNGHRLAPCREACVRSGVVTLGLTVIDFAHNGIEPGVLLSTLRGDVEALVQKIHGARVYAFPWPMGSLVYILWDEPRGSPLDYAVRAHALYYLCLKIGCLSRPELGSALLATACSILRLMGSVCEPGKMRDLARAIAERGEQAVARVAKAAM